MLKIKALAVGLYMTLGAIAIGFGLNTPDPVEPERIVAYEVVEIQEVKEETPEIEVSVMVIEEPKIEVEVIEEEPEYSLTDEEIELIALITMAEAEGESEEGKRLVIDTILNRVDHSRFPDTVEGVIYQKNQFSCVWDGRADRCYVQDEIVELVKEELINRTNYDVMFFRAGTYGKYGTPLFKVENHYFSSYA